jgi:hypothetical protein
MKKNHVILLVVVALVSLVAVGIYLTTYIDSTMIERNGTCGLETCHGLDITCGPNPAEVCTEMYMVGDRCLQYAHCAIVEGTCQQVDVVTFNQCKGCVQKCIDENTDSESVFACEGTCP